MTPSRAAHAATTTLGALLLVLPASSCSGERVPPPAPPPVAATTTEPAARTTIRRLLDSEPQVVVIEVRVDPTQVARSVVLHGHGGSRRQAELLPHPEGGGWLFESVDTLGRGRIGKRRGETELELLLPSGALQRLGSKVAYDIDPYILVHREHTFALVEAATGREVGSRPTDPAERSQPLALAHGGKRLIETIAGESSGLGDLVRISSSPSLSPALSRPGQLGMVAGRFVLVEVLAPAGPGGVEYPPVLDALEIVDLESAKVIDTLRLPGALRAGAEYALSPDGERVARSANGGVQVYERASKRWTEKRRANPVQKDLAPPTTRLSFTTDGKTLCLEHGGPFLFPPAPAPAGAHRRLLFEWGHGGAHGDACHVTLTPGIAGREPLQEAHDRSYLQHIPGDISPGRDLGAFLDVEKVPAGSEQPREVHLTVVELPSNTVRYQVSAGRWKPPDSGADHLTVSFVPGGVWVNVVGDDNRELGGLFDLTSGKRPPPPSTKPVPPRTLAELAARAGFHPGPERWSKVDIEGGALVAEDARGAQVTLASEAPLPKKVHAWLGGPASGATVIGDDKMGWMFSNADRRLLGVLVPSGAGVVALLDGGGFDTAGAVDEASLGCLAGSRLLPLSACRDRARAAGALASAVAGTRGWLEEP